MVYPIETASVWLTNQDHLLKVPACDMSVLFRILFAYMFTFTSWQLVSAENITGRYQVEIELLRLENPYGVGRDGMPCDPLVIGCDTRIYAYLDWLKPEDRWPGSRDIEADDTIFEVTESTPTSFNLNKVLVNHVCGDVKKVVTLRVRVVDQDHIYRGEDDMIGEFNCRFNVPPAVIEEVAIWSEAHVCEPVVAQSMIWLTFRARVFKVEGRCVDGTTYGGNQ